MPEVHLLAAVHPAAADRYQAYLSAQPTLAAQIVTSHAEARAILADPDRYTDVFAVDNALGGAFELIRELRQAYPRLLIILLDEGADFSMPGRADDVTTDPFTNDDLVRRIHQLLRERRTETLRADSLPPVRAIAKLLRQASGAAAKIEAAVKAVMDLGYDFVAFYRLDQAPPLFLSTVVGPSALTTVAPEKQSESTLVGWVAQNGQIRIAGPQDEINYALIKRGRLGAGVGVPVGIATRFGVLLACKEQPNTIHQEHAMMLELICGQLAAALAKEKF